MRRVLCALFLLLCFEGSLSGVAAAQAIGGMQQAISPGSHSMENMMDELNQPWVKDLHNLMHGITAETLGLEDLIQRKQVVLGSQLHNTAADLVEEQTMPVSVKSTEERLQELDNLWKLKLVSPDDYRRWKTEILRAHQHAVVPKAVAPKASVPEGDTQLGAHPIPHEAPAPAIALPAHEIIARQQGPQPIPLPDTELEIAPPAIQDALEHNAPLPQAPPPMVLSASHMQSITKNATEQISQLTDLGFNDVVGMTFGVGVFQLLLGHRHLQLSMTLMIFVIIFMAVYYGAEYGKTELMKTSAFGEADTVLGYVGVNATREVEELVSDESSMGVAASAGISAGSLLATFIKLLPVIAGLAVTALAYNPIHSLILSLKLDGKTQLYAMIGTLCGIFLVIAISAFAMRTNAYILITSIFGATLVMVAALVHMRAMADIQTLTANIEDRQFTEAQKVIIAVWIILALAGVLIQRKFRKGKKSKKEEKEE